MADLGQTQTTQQVRGVSDLLPTADLVRWHQLGWEVLFPHIDIVDISRARRSPGAERAAVMFTLIMTARLNEVDPQAWLADVFMRIAAIAQNRLHELLPWEWKWLNERQQPPWPPEPDAIVAARCYRRHKPSR
jgi:hypothetical protein